MNKTKLYGWIIVLLAVLNLTTIGTVVVHHIQHTQLEDAFTLDSENNVRINGRYFKQELGFDSDQMQVFRTANRAFQPTARNLLSTIDSLKLAAFEELHHEQPDTLTLNQLAIEIGYQHGKLKQLTHHFYLQIKNTCNTEQALELQKVFSPLFRDDHCNTMNNTPRHKKRTDQ